MTNEPKSERLTLLDQALALIEEFRAITAEFRTMSPDERAQVIDRIRAAWRTKPHGD